MRNMENVTELPTLDQKMRAAIRNIEALSEDVARCKRKQYDAYVAEGFTPEQALRLIMGGHHG